MWQRGETQSAYTGLTHAFGTCVCVCVCIGGQRPCHTDFENGVDEDLVGVRETEEGSAGGLLEVLHASLNSRMLLLQKKTIS